MRVIHPWSPVYDSFSQVLILGTIPSPVSRETGFYYGHKQNRFWRILEHLFQEKCPQSPEGKKAFLLSHHIALWDVLASCDIRGASDASIRNPVPNCMTEILKKSSITGVFCTGQKAASLYDRLILPSLNVAAVRLPSPSPANCACSFPELCAAYAQILPHIH